MGACAYIYFYSYTDRCFRVSSEYRVSGYVGDIHLTLNTVRYGT